MRSAVSLLAAVSGSHAVRSLPWVELRQARQNAVPVETVRQKTLRQAPAEQWIKEGKNAVKWTRLSCRSMRANAVRLQLHALAYNLANFFRTLVLPDEVERWSLTTLREKVVRIGAKVVAHARYTVFQMAEVASLPRELFRRILDLIDDLR